MYALSIEEIRAALAFFNLKPNFTKQELKKAFRLFALEHHPDRPNGDAEKFKQGQKYHETLEKALETLGSGVEDYLKTPPVSINLSDLNDVPHQQASSKNFKKHTVDSNQSQEGFENESPSSLGQKQTNQNHEDPKSKKTPGSFTKHLRHLAKNSFIYIWFVYHLRKAISILIVFCIFHFIFLQFNIDLIQQSYSLFQAIQRLYQSIME